MIKKTISGLLAKYKAGTLTAEEKRLLDTWFNKQAAGSPAELPEERLEELSARLRSNLPLAEGHRVRTLRRPLTVAASIILAGSVAVFLWLHHAPVKPVQVAAVQQHDIAPGHHQATLTLANGTTMVLTKGLNGLLAIQGQTQIKANNNTIVYNAQVAEQTVSYNTLTTVRGEQSPYPLSLADGTKVWLNAESSITFPTAFTGKERIVKITGEAYFEVAHNAAQPFKVIAPNQTVEDIGTAFDVNAYNDETTTKTTLISGKVKVGELYLKPGEQTDGKQVKAANTGVVTAWREGKFRFHDDNIQTIMRQLARWYDIDVNYEGKPSDEGFDAKISKDRNISAVLDVLERTQGVRFKIEGRRVTVIQ